MMCSLPLSAAILYHRIVATTGDLLPSCPTSSTTHSTPPHVRGVLALSVHLLTTTKLHTGFGAAQLYTGLALFLVRSSDNIHWERG